MKVKLFSKIVSYKKITHNVWCLCVLTAMLAEAARNKRIEFRTYRVEKHYAVTSGKWYAILGLFSSTV